MLSRNENTFLMFLSTFLETDSKEATPS